MSEYEEAAKKIARKAPYNQDAVEKAALKALQQADRLAREDCAEIAANMTDGIHIVYCTNIATAIRESIKERDANK